ncbi:MULTISPECIES: autotransporter domain-containing protein [Bradyrhizobium]|uniref:autotransporter domain-containing protein n=1 Tax=Bradyrhizobium TaxID=374 RepID=UPI00155E1E78|nr:MULTISPECIES: autotransporter domain-containing protein [Bradyrhizobium]MDD1516378.1 autotransporter outer membrane beta-barrel domain-containing protein [Bradyrhizobium sp. WBAH30]MDD1542585.1 autotransporter outer membrane beta-barrel domain-containing protein [Bradyrhizobium sp. WBAH41]MDD1554282.1 autotransporter outer membrane beta-barrel domain-containing protein [Bradyrhizobium sp. WBAH23]MDD1562233.1 autotransporter outer membrane beta-barrel domain-containing protein [Bradyrhizobium
MRQFVLALTGRISSTKLLSGAVVALSLSSSAAFAQCTGAVTGAGAGFFGAQLAAISAATGAASGSVAGALGTTNTAFLTQQGSAFVSAPADPKPEQPGGGIWIRGVGGEVTNKFTSTSTGTVNAGIFNPVLGAASNFNCAGSVHQSFGGVQVGQDISRLNWRGWNVHVGTTAGYLSSKATDNAGGSTNFEVPFLGAYVVATYGRFFADVMVREEFYRADLTNVGVGLFNQQIGARGTSVSASVGYNFALANNWFIEPSAGFTWSRTNVDDYTLSGGAVSQGIVSTVTTSPIESKIGRLTLRGGTTITSGNLILQPFASVSVFHEFAGDVTSSVNSLNASVFGVIPIAISQNTSTSRVGTYGQYSLGVAGQLANTGWLGFVRGDYRNGENIDGWTANAGLRYQFTPEQIASIMPLKAPAKAAGTVIAPTNWTGVYVGGSLGVEYGKTDIRFAGDPIDGNNPRVFGGLGGLQVGYNYQMPSNWVLGIEGDIAATNLRGSRTCTTVQNLALLLNCQNSSDWIATLSGRVGYSWNRTLIYAKAGGAWAQDRTNVNCVFGPLNGAVVGVFQLGPCVNQFGGATDGFSSSGYRSGWLIGYGTEFDLGKNWSAKAEYDYIDLGSRTSLMSDGVTTMRDSGSLSQVKIGVNYRFTPGAVIAKY